MKKTFLLLIAIISLNTIIQIGSASEDTPTCEDYITQFETCKVVTPSLTCLEYTYNISDVALNTTIVKNGALKQLNSTSSYFFIFNNTDKEGPFLITLCDRSTANIRVGPGCRIQNTFDQGMMWLCIGMIIMCIIMFFVLLFSPENVRGGE